MSENLVEKYATKTYIDKDYKDIVVSEKSFVNLVQENKKQKEVLDKIKEEVEARIEYCKQHQSEDEWECCIEELQNIHKLLEKVYE